MFSLAKIHQYPIVLTINIYIFLHFRVIFKTKKAEEIPRATLAILQKMIFLFHPDYTVGGRISLSHEGLALSQTITAGMELRHASKKSDSIVLF